MNELKENKVKPEDTFTWNDLKELLKAAGGEMTVLANEAYLLGYRRALQAVSR